MTEQTQVTRGWSDEAIVPTYSPAAFSSGAWSGFLLRGINRIASSIDSSWRYRGKRAGSPSSGLVQTRPNKRQRVVTSVTG